MTHPSTPRRRAPLLLALAAAALLAAAPGRLAAQDPQPTPEQMQAQMAMMGPMMGHMMQAMMEGMLAALAKPETAQNLATFTKNYFDALVAKGFTREEALRIVVAVGVPSAPGMR